MNAHSQPHQIEMSSALTAFKFDEGKAVFDQVIGQQTEPHHHPSLPAAVNRIHIGIYKALVSSTQTAGHTRYGAFLGTFWKKEKGNSIWRAGEMIVSSNLDSLAKHCNTRMNDLTKLVAVAVVNITGQKVVTDTPDANLLAWMKDLSTHSAGYPLAMHVHTASKDSNRPSLRVFEFKTLDSSPQQVHMNFLTKRLAQEEFRVFDADSSASPSVREYVNTILTASWLIYCLYKENCACKYIALPLNKCAALPFHIVDVEIHTVFMERFGHPYKE